MGLQYSITAIGSVIIQTATNSLGSIAVASVTAADKIGFFFCSSFDALGGHHGHLCGAKCGRGQIKAHPPGREIRHPDGIRLRPSPPSPFSFFFGDRIPLLFVNAAETTVIEQAHLFLICVSSFYNSAGLRETCGASPSRAWASPPSPFRPGSVK